MASPTGERSSAVTVFGGSGADHDDPEARARLSDQLDSLERKVGGLRLPESFAPLVYTLRLHINVVRSRFLASQSTPAGCRPASTAPST